VASRGAALRDVLCFSHLRWDFVYQRPQHLLTRCARHYRVFYIEEPFFGDNLSVQLRLDRKSSSLAVVTPLLPRALEGADNQSVLRVLLGECTERFEISSYALWFYTPMALPMSRQLTPQLCVYDCMDELSMFKGAPTQLDALEAELFERADLVFTGGSSLYERKRRRHPRVHLFPSAVDAAHFQYRGDTMADPADQRALPRPRFGFYGVLDERLDVDLVRAVAKAKPEWQFIFLGPIVKIDPAALPHSANIHYLGQKPYDELPDYLAHWDVAILPFAMNDATRFISPTKTLEYLAAGKPVISTPLSDLVEPFGRRGWVEIVADAGSFIASAERMLRRAGDRAPAEDVRRFLASMSWDRTWQRMHELMQGHGACRVDALAAAR